LPDRRRHRGPHPEDGQAFSDAALPALRAAVADLSWLLGRGYAPTSSLKLVGDRWRLDERQRMAVLRSSCSDADRERRATTRVDSIRGRILWIDAYNVLTTVESALAGAVVLAARDGCWRDLASMHGTFRAVEETDPALALIAAHLEAQAVARHGWLLDAPVSNSGRLAARIRTLLPMVSVELVRDPDAILRVTPEVAATADSAILDAGPAWYNLARAVIAERVPDARVVDLSSGSLGP
jgi:hypothetical protein